MNRELNFHGVPWSDQEINFLRAVIAEGLSAGQSADRMLSVGFERTRNAVIGKYHKLLKRHKVLPLARSKENGKRVELTPREIMIGDLALRYKRATIYEICEAIGADFRTEFADVLWAINMVLGKRPREIGSELDCLASESMERIAKMRAIVAREVAA